MVFNSNMKFTNYTFIISSKLSISEKIFNLREKRKTTSKCWENGCIRILFKTMRKCCVRDALLELIYFRTNV